MWQYLWAHIIYHLVRWFPRNNRLKIFLLVMILSVAFLVPQLLVLYLDHSKRWCGQPLFEFLIVSIILTLIMIGFTFLFMVMVPVPGLVKIIFHVFGVLGLITGLSYIILTSKATDCKNTTEALYTLSVILASITGISIGFYVLMLPFWLINTFWPKSVLDPPARTGICYEPVKCCSCLWHI
ncbi:uncharacterized protein LOC126828612 [Patella vulgata]|uniref:uncharacterized protein LOC126828612 n=1 Tax=Patella vulgata TaxID=6465 RepID=UPI00217F5FA8|nr:uncharacterized protein LOC126828612 [Patella vulgata]XP_050414448.1 uncharacterized protein LOC126828612 [Patella vulgata]XP_055958572.1 uncharacterized protein LOC126828612 [Patella vulgata]